MQREPIFSGFEELAQKKLRGPKPSKGPFVVFEVPEERPNTANACLTLVYRDRVPLASFEVPLVEVHSSWFKEREEWEIEA